MWEEVQRWGSPWAAAAAQWLSSGHRYFPFIFSALVRGLEMSSLVVQDGSHTQQRRERKPFPEDSDNFSSDPFGQN